MKKFVVIALSANLHTGTVELTDRQAKDRSHLIEPVPKKKGLYNIIETITFKNGEGFSFDGEINKALLEEVGEVVDVKAKKAEDDKAKKKVKAAADALATAQSRISELETEVTSQKDRADEAEAKIVELEAVIATSTVAAKDTNTSSDVVKEEKTAESDEDEKSSKAKDKK